jgi:hypothetical protein
MLATLSHKNLQTILFTITKIKLLSLTFPIPTSLNTFSHGKSYRSVSLEMEKETLV